VKAGTDIELMLHVKDGNTGELGILFERHHERLLSFFMKMTGNRGASEDLVQETFVRMLRYRGSFRGDGGGFTPWMYRLGRNACTDHLRKVGRRRESDPGENEPACDDPAPAESFEKAESIGLLRQALLRLAPEKREVLVLSRYDLKKYEEIAAILECPVGTVKARVHRALQELKKIYDGLLSGASA